MGPSTDPQRACTGAQQSKTEACLWYGGKSSMICQSNHSSTRPETVKVVSNPSESIKVMAEYVSDVDRSYNETQTPVLHYRSHHSTWDGQKNSFGAITLSASRLVVFEKVIFCHMCLTLTQLTTSQICDKTQRIMLPVSVCFVQSLLLTQCIIIIIFCLFVGVCVSYLLSSLCVFFPRLCPVLLFWIKTRTFPCSENPCCNIRGCWRRNWRGKMAPQSKGPSGTSCGGDIQRPSPA